ncbi:unnamed protein product [Owenia fusiformis]|uniref:TIR domain-containing protein n=1 Tax=Owenia fusiformis TaxID=6347 RepID=A0A8S4PZF5_OWEFU|nr:unnamed protein product [Owenia fusiformis]
MEVIKISSSISATFLFIIMMGVVFYMKRHRMEYLFLLSRQMARRLIGRTRSRGNRLYKYHGFVCWSSQEDISIIVLIQGKLEMDFGLRLAIGDRDFEVGGYIIDNIVHFITASRKTIIFLSNNYLNSKWCMFELQIAMNKSQEVEFDTVVMILLHDINDLDKAKMPPSLTNYLKRKTYLQWPASSAQQPVFWLRLKDVLDFGEIQNDQPLVINPGENDQVEQNDGSHTIDVREQNDQSFVVNPDENDGSNTDVAVDEQSFDEDMIYREPLLRLN